MTNDRLLLVEKPKRRRIPVKLAVALLATTFLCSCTTAVYDVRQLQQPVVLNDNPFLSPGTRSTMNMAKVDTYTATVARGQMTASAGNTTVSTVTQENQAQLDAFQKIGGQANRTICNVALDTDYLAINCLFVLADKVTIQAGGDVEEFQPPTAAPANASMIDASTNQVSTAVPSSANQVHPITQ